MGSCSARISTARKPTASFQCCCNALLITRVAERLSVFKAAASGYVVIVQDVRGRYTSEGEWYTFKHESNDGYDTVEWAAALPYSNGKVGMWGGSYVGATQMLTAIAHPPHLAGICPVVTASNYHENWTYQGGAFEQWFNESWTSGLAQDTFDRQRSKRIPTLLEGVWKLPLASYPLFNFSDPSAAPATTASLAPYFLDWLAHPNYDDYWKQVVDRRAFRGYQCSGAHVAAWYDIFQGGSLRNYVGIKAHGGSDAARKGQHLFVTIGGHAGGGPKNRRSRLRSRGCRVRRRRSHLEMVRLPLQGRAERICREAGKDFRHGRQPVARRG